MDPGADLPSKLSAELPAELPTALPTDLRAALAEGRVAGVAALDARLMLARLVDRAPSWVWSHDETPLEAGTARRWRAWLARRAAGEPLAYLFGEKEFAGHLFHVTPDTLVPRPETEHLVEWALERARAALADDTRATGAARPADAPLAIVDLGTGSGAIAVSLALALGHRARARVTMTDRSPAALAIARANAARLGATVESVVSDWWQGLGGRRFDLVVSNPPYVAGGDPALAALRHEPADALTPGGDGLGALAAIVDGASAHVAPGGWLLLEHGHDQAAWLRERLMAAGWAEVQTRRDLAGHERLSGGRRPIAR